MSDIPPMADSALSALQRGWSQFDRGAGALVSGASADIAPPQDSADVRSGSVVDTEPMLSGMRDMLLGREQILAGAFLLHAYNENRQALYDMLKP